MINNKSVNRFFKHVTSFIFCMIPLAFGLFGHAAPASAIGISPGKLEFPDMLPTTVVERTIEVSRGGFEDIDDFTIKVEGSGADYIKITNNKLVFGADELTAPLGFVLKPTKAKPGKYEISINVVPIIPASDPIDLEEGETVIDSDFLLGVTAVINFSVGSSAREELEIKHLFLENVSDNEKREKTVRARIFVKNTGNVPMSVDKLEIVGSGNFFREVPIKPPVTVPPYAALEAFSDSFVIPPEQTPPLTVDILLGEKKLLSYNVVTWSGASASPESDSVSWFRKFFVWLLGLIGKIRK